MGGEPQGSGVGSSADEAVRAPCRPRPAFAGDGRAGDRDEARPRKHQTWSTVRAPGTRRCGSPGPARRLGCSPRAGPPSHCPGPSISTVALVTGEVHRCVTLYFLRPQTSGSPVSRVLPLEPSATTRSQPHSAVRLCAPLPPTALRGVRRSPHSRQPRLSSSCSSSSSLFSHSSHAFYFP